LRCRLIYHTLLQPNRFHSKRYGFVNGTSGFAVGKGKKRGPAAFIFDSEAGVISGWSPTAARAAGPGYRSGS